MLGSLFAFLAVALGAFAAHGLESRLSADDMDTYQTAARYQMYHALALLGVAYAGQRLSSPLTAVAGWLFVAGIILFSGSLYLLAVSGLKALGAVAPLGGVCFLGGWVCLGLAAWRG